MSSRVGLPPKRMVKTEDGTVQEAEMNSRFADCLRCESGANARSNGGWNVPRGRDELVVHGLPLM